MLASSPGSSLGMRLHTCVCVCACRNSLVPRPLPGDEATYVCVCVYACRNSLVPRPLPGDEATYVCVCVHVEIALSPGLSLHVCKGPGDNPDKGVIINGRSTFLPHLVLSVHLHLTLTVNCQQCVAGSVDKERGGVLQ